MAAVDRAVLRRVGERLGAVKFVTSVSVCPPERIDGTVAEFDTQYYPDGVQRCSLVVRAYVDGDFNIVYREDWGGSAAWTCRWDRHENPHNARDHYHEPPDAEQIRDRSYPDDIFEVVRVVLEDIEERLGGVWDATNRP